MEYAVKGETRDGRITILALRSIHTRTPRITPSKCPIWKRVWIELISPPLMANDE